MIFAIGKAQRHTELVPVTSRRRRSSEYMSGWARERMMTLPFRARDATLFLKSCIDADPPVILLRYLFSRQGWFPANHRPHAYAGRTQGLYESSAYRTEPNKNRVKTCPRRERCRVSGNRELSLFPFEPASYAGCREDSCCKFALPALKDCPIRATCGSSRTGTRRMMNTNHVC